MIVERNDEEKKVYLWFTKSESRDDELRASLKPKIAELKKQKYFVVMFCSGDGDLIDNTVGMLKHNLQLAAQK